MGSGFLIEQTKRKVNSEMKKINKRQIGPAALCSVCGRTFGGPAGSWHLRRHMIAEHGAPPDEEAIIEAAAGLIRQVQATEIPPVETHFQEDQDMASLFAIVLLDGPRLQNLLASIEHQVRMLNRRAAVVKLLLDSEAK
jgi:hypothetical protein